MNAFKLQLAQLRTQLAARWGALAERERMLVALAVAVVLAVATWALAIAPAWRTWTTAPQRAEALEQQWQEMQRLAAEARALRATPPLPMPQAQAALTAAASRLGDKARLIWQGERATLSVSALPAAQLVAWIGEVRLSARARVIEAQLTRTPAETYNGAVILAIGGAR